MGLIYFCIKADVCICYVTYIVWWCINVNQNDPLPWMRAAITTTCRIILTCRSNDVRFFPNEFIRAEFKVVLPSPTYINFVSFLYILFEFVLEQNLIWYVKNNELKALTQSPQRQTKPWRGNSKCEIEYSHNFIYISLCRDKTIWGGMIWCKQQQQRQRCLIIQVIQHFSVFIGTCLNFNLILMNYFSMEQDLFFAYTYTKKAKW